MVLEHLEPRHVFTIFEGLFVANPRPSGKEGRVRDAIAAWATAKGLGVAVDATGNVLLSKPASPGMELVPAFLLQGHLDMVCESDRPGGFDFDLSPVPVIIDGDWIAADGTTLGADNGLGASIALGMLIDEDPAFQHGPLEVLLTVAEETGLDGALGLDPVALGIAARVMINVDSEELGVITIGAAGGGSTILRRVNIALERVPRDARCLVFSVSGLAGGHSGVDIHLPRANAIKIVARVLSAIPGDVVFGLVSWDGGTRHNAIPRSSRVVLAVHEPNDLPGVIEVVTTEKDAILSYHGRLDGGREVTEPRLSMTVEEQPLEDVHALSPGETASTVALSCALPHGPARFSPFIPGLVETSSNLAMVSINAADGSCRFEVNTRSSEGPELEATRRGITRLGGALGWVASMDPAYPGWRPDPASTFLAFARSVYESVTGAPVAVRAIHAGLECGIISARLPELDGRVISIGPAIEHPHSPHERARIADVARVYDVVKEMIKRIASEQFTP